MGRKVDYFQAPSTLAEGTSYAAEYADAADIPVVMSIVYHAPTLLANKPYAIRQRS